MAKRFSAVFVTSIALLASARAQAQTGDNPTTTPTPQATQQPAQTPPGNAQEQWDFFGGGIPTHLLSFELNPVGLDPRFAYSYGVSRSFSLGVAVGVYPIYSTTFIGEQTGNNSVGFVGEVPLRIALARGGRVSAGLHLTPGVQLFTRFANRFLRSVNVTLDVGFNVGCWIREGVFLLGVGVDAPLTFVVDLRNFVAPILVGGVAEWHVAQAVVVTLDAKFGPTFDNRARPAYFGYRTVIGLAFGL